MIARALKFISQSVVGLLAHLEIEGRDCLPEPPYIVAVNHLGIFDAPFVYSQLGGPDFTGWAAEKYENNMLVGPLLRAGRGIFIERGEVDRQAIEAAVAWLRDGRVFALAPEGTRSPTASLARGKTGIAYLADETEVPVVPIAITGTETVGRQFLRLRRPRFTFRIGAPIRLPPVSTEARMADLRHNTDEVMCRLAALLPPSYRGYYADHPRTKELLDAGYADSSSSGESS